MSLILDEVIKDLHRQEMKGLGKYGTTLDTANLTELDLLNHALQEALDLSMYLKALIKLKEHR